MFRKGITKYMCGINIHLNIDVITFNKSICKLLYMTDTHYQNKHCSTYCFWHNFYGLVDVFVYTQIPIQILQIWLFSMKFNPMQLIIISIF